MNMKKLALTSLLAFFAVSSAHAANIIDNNPLYRPDSGHFYSVTTLESHTKTTNLLTLGEEFGYGITPDMAVIIGTSMSQSDWFENSQWGDLSLGINYRMLNMNGWKADFMAAYSMSPVWGDHRPFMDESDTMYTWSVGARGGYVGNGFTIAGHVMFDYTNSESFNWGDEKSDVYAMADFESIHALRLGLDAQLLLNESWNLIAGVEYHADLDNWEDGNGYWTGKFGANYNIDETKFIGAFITKEMHHVNDGEWDVADGFGFGMTFGIDF